MAKKEENIFQKRSFLIKSIAIPVCIAIVIFFFVWLLFLNNNNFCGDGTAYGKCSDARPYYCLNGEIIENSSYCGCSNVSVRMGNSCQSIYEYQPEVRTLKYIINGRESEINFTVYKNLSDYFYALPVAIYQKAGEKISRVDFKLRDLNNKEQYDLLYPLVAQIENITKDKTEQARIAVSLVQNIQFGASNKTTGLGKEAMNYSRYPYQVLYDMSGVCGEKSELLTFLLKEMGYGTVIFYFSFENHEAVGIKCPLKESYLGTGYCFVESGGPAILSDSDLDYVIGKLYSTPQILFISNGTSLGTGLYEYNDASALEKIQNLMDNGGVVNPLQLTEYKLLQGKYGLQKVYNA